MGYILGLDIGERSIGFAGVDLKNGKVLFANAHLFGVAIDDKGNPLNPKDRRPRRGQRRIFRRRVQRLSKLRTLFGITSEQQTILFYGKEKRTSVYQLRAEALTRLLSREEFFRVLYHVAKHRAFQSNALKESNEEEAGKINEALGDFEKRWVAYGVSTTPGQILYHDLTAGDNPRKQETHRIRNTEGDYRNFLKRDWLRLELKKIIEKQKEFGSTQATSDLYSFFWKEIFSQRPLKSSEELIGYCSVIPAERRGPRHAPTANLFIFWSDLNNLKIINQFGIVRTLTIQEKEKISELVFKNRKITYRQIRNELKSSMSENDTFNKVRYHLADEGKSKKKSVAAPLTWAELQKKAEEKESFCDLTGIYRLKDLFPTLLLDIKGQKDLSFYDDVARIVSFYDDEGGIRDELAKKNHALAESQIRELFELAKTNDFRGTMGLSLKAASLVLPDIQRGETFHQAKINRGLVKERTSKSKLPKFELTRNPVVDHALAESRKVINAIFARHRFPEKIILEFSRDLAYTKKQREEIERRNNANRLRRESARKWFEDDVLKSSRSASEGEVLRATLWQEQNGMSAYSLNCIPPDALKDGENKVQFEHIFPESLVCDNSYMNKVLVLTGENQNKGNMIPYDFLKASRKDFDEHWEKIIAFSARLPHAKKKRILAKKLDVEGWQRRSLNDTSHICRRFRNHLLEHIDLGDGDRVQTRKGAITHYLRHEWGFDSKDRDKDDRHHILDAVILACSETSTVQKVFSWERKHDGDVIAKYPWPSFRNDVLSAVNDPTRLISRRARHTVTGEAHGANPYGIRDDGKTFIKRIKVSELTEKNIDAIFQSGTGERNAHLKEILRERLKEYNWDAKKAFIEPVYLTKKGEERTKNSAQIKHIHVVASNIKSGRELNGGFVSNGLMPRVDVFYRNEKYYLQPIYVSDFKKKTLPSPVIKGRGKEAKEEIIGDEYFIFSLFKRDFVRVVDGGEETSGYYDGLDVSGSGGRITIFSHENKKNAIRKSTQNLDSFEKYTVNYFGEKHKVKGEKRLGLAKSARTKSGTAVAEKRTAATGER